MEKNKKKGLFDFLKRDTQAGLFDFLKRDVRTDVSLVDDHYHHFLVKKPRQPRLLRKKVLLKAVAVLCVLTILLGMSLAFFFGKRTVAAAWFDDTYSYRVKFTFTHNADISAERAVTYTLDTAELIAANIMQSDCDDTRFTDGNGKPLLYDLTGTCNNASTTYEVIFPSIVNGSNLAYVYYGNPGAANAEISSTSYTALTPSGGDPAAETAPTANDEQGPAPISYWSFNEAQGATANDYSAGSNNDLTITNALWKTTDLCVFGNCLYFTGDNAVRASKTYSADTELLPGTASFTVSGWFKHTSTAGADTLISRVDATDGVGWKVYMDSSGFMCFGIDAVAGTFPNDSACSTTSYADSKWHFVTAVKSTTASITIYIDGIQIAQDAAITATTLNGTNASFVIGNDFDNGDIANNGWDGFIDEVKYYNFAKTAAQITTEFASKSAPKGTAASFGAGDAATSLNQGLVGYWKMDESSWNGTAGEVLDTSGNANNYVSACIGGACTKPSTTAAKFANGGSFDGTEDYISGSLTPNIANSSFTISGWVYQNSAAGAEFLAIGNQAANQAIEFQVFASGNVRCGFYSNDLNLSNAFTAGTWQHLACTFDVVSGKRAIYLNGILRASDTTASPFSGNNTLTIGKNVYANEKYWAGKIDDVRVYNRALSPAEVSQLYNFAPGPVGWWKMDENTGTSANDTSGNGNTGTLTNSPVWAPGKVGQGIYFDGSSSDRHVNIPTNANINFAVNDNFSVSVWGKIPATQVDTVSTQNMLMEKWTCCGGGYPFVIRIWNQTDARNGKIIACRYDGTNNPCIDSVQLVNDDAWHHIEFVKNGSTLYLYIDGIFNNSTSDATTGTTTNASALYVGIRNAADNPLIGTLDDLKIYNYARSPKQIVEDMNAGHPAGGSPIGSQAVYWNFDEGQGTTANNKGTASSSNGTLTSIASPATSTSGWTFTGKVNKGIIFDGTDDNVVIATANDAAVDFATTEQFSGSAWVYITTMPGSGNQDAIIAKWDDTGNLAAYKLYVENDDADTTGNFEVQIYDESASQAITASQAIDQVAVNTWYHIAFTFNGGTAGAAGDLKLYVNGQYTAQNAANTSFLGLEDKASDFTVGDYDAGDVVANNTAFTGTIDEVKVYSGLLSQSEIQIDMNAGSSLAMGGVLGTQDNEGFGGNPPVAWWKLDENTGTTTVDSSGNGNTSSAFTGNTTWTIGKTGSALTFDGTDDVARFVETTSTDLGATTDSYTVSAWFKTSTNYSSSAGIVEKATGATFPYNLFINSSEFVCFAVRDGAAGPSLCPSSITVNDGLWHHATGVRNVSTDTVYLYLDGKFIASTNDTTTVTAVNNVDISIGNGGGSYTGEDFNGIIDEAKIYNYARTPAQIAYDYSRGAPVAHYKFDECQGATAYNAAIAGSGAAAGMNGTITPGSLGNTTVGSCGSGTSTEMWNDGTTGKYNSALGFDGADDYITVTNADSIDQNVGLLNGLTASAWFYANNAGEGTGGRIFTKNAATWCRADTLSGSNLDIECSLDLATDATLNVSTALTTGTWNNVVMTQTNDADDEITIWVNGKNVGSSTDGVGDPSADTANLIIGNDSISGTATFDGLIDQFQIYNYEMTTPQILRLYNEGSAVRFGPETGSP